MEISSYFIENKCLFGPYPTNEQVIELEKNGITYFIDLTTRYEKIKRYNCSVNYISYPIKDNSIPDDSKSFLELVKYISDLIRDSEKHEKFYIHCKGGHGRSGLLVACILCYIKKIDAIESIRKTTEFHRNRPTLKQKWYDVECPNINCQQNFIKLLFG